MRVTDTRTRGLEEVTPAAGRVLRVYACGPTVYRYAHVGNLRTFLLHDVLARTAQVLHGWQVRVVQNITDVGHLQDDTNIDAAGEDKVAAAARRAGTSPFELARFYEERFHRDLAGLNIHPAGDYPRASDCIDLMIDLIERLLAAGNAYRADDGSVFFDARSFPGYGEISGNRLADLRPSHTGGETHPGKRFHADWALWKSGGAHRQMVWEAPWGSGFPGWHIECSAMSLDRLGTTIDVHTGGIDLRFPHHEDERAQSEAAVGHPVVTRWVHGEHLLAEGRKMSKSTGNVVLLSDVADRGFDPLALRLFFLSGRYRQQLNLTWDALGAADRRLARWRSRVAEWAEQPSAPVPAAYLDRLHAAFADDLDTPAALVALGELERDDSVAPGAKFETFAYADRVLGLDLARTVGAAPAPLPEGARELLEQRARARDARDWGASDRLREQLAGLGVAVTDTAGGQEWSLTTGGGSHRPSR